MADSLFLLPASDEPGCSLRRILLSLMLLCELEKMLAERQHHRYSNKEREYANSNLHACRRTWLSRASSDYGPLPSFLLSGLPWQPVLSAFCSGVSSGFEVLVGTFNINRFSKHNLSRYGRMGPTFKEIPKLHKLSPDAPDRGNFCKSSTYLFNSNNKHIKRCIKLFQRWVTWSNSDIVSKDLYRLAIYEKHRVSW